MIGHVPDLLRYPGNHIIIRFVDLFTTIYSVPRLFCLLALEVRQRQVYRRRQTITFSHPHHRIRDPVSLLLVEVPGFVDSEF